MFNNSIFAGNIMMMRVRLDGSGKSVLRRYEIAKRSAVCSSSLSITGCCNSPCDSENQVNPRFKRGLRWFLEVKPGVSEVYEINLWLVQAARWYNSRTRFNLGKPPKNQAKRELNQV